MPPCEGQPWRMERVGSLLMPWHKTGKAHSCGRRVGHNVAARGLMIEAHEAVGTRLLPGDAGVEIAKGPVAPRSHLLQPGASPRFPSLTDCFGGPKQKRVGGGFASLGNVCPSRCLYLCM